MTAEYDVEVKPKKHYKQSIYTEKFLEFYKTNHKNMKLNCDTVEEAKKGQHILCMLISRKKIFDINIHRNDNEIYVIRNSNDDIN